MTNWDQRQLCPDGGCVGLIGPEGTCKVCGRAAPNWGDERKRGLVADAAAVDEEDKDLDETSNDDGVDDAGDEDSDEDEANDEDDESDGDDDDDSDDDDDDGDDGDDDDEEGDEGD